MAENEKNLGQEGWYDGDRARTAIGELKTSHEALQSLLSENPTMMKSLFYALHKTLWVFGGLSVSQEYIKNREEISSHMKKALIATAEATIALHGELTEKEKKRLAKKGSLGSAGDRDTDRLWLHEVIDSFYQANEEST